MAAARAPAARFNLAKWREFESFCDSLLAKLGLFTGRPATDKL
ncbi:MAG: hypothetical protein ACRC6F_04020 [Aeromonas sp.]